jgi:hypothetical protein
MADCKSKNSCRGRQHGMCDHCERELIMRRVRMTTSMHGARCACDRGTARSLCTLVRMLRGSAASPPEPAPLSGRQRVSTESAPDVTLTSVRLRFQPGSWVKIRRRDEGFWCEAGRAMGSCMRCGTADLGTASSSSDFLTHSSGTHVSAGTLSAQCSEPDPPSTDS